MDANLSIIVYKGDPVDLQKTRHTALFVVFLNSSTVLIHVAGAPGFFTVEQRPEEQPTLSKRIAKKIDVGTIKGKTKAQIKSTIAATPVKNNSHEWNCHNWVGEALTRLVNLGWITAEARSPAFTRMVDTTMEAVDEE